MDKISMQQAQALLKQAAASITTLKAQRDEARAKLAEKERVEEARKIATEMESKNLKPDLSFDEKVAAVLSAGDMRVTGEAVKLASPQPHAFEGFGDFGSGSGNSEQDLMTFVLSGDSPE